MRPAVYLVPVLAVIYACTGRPVGDATESAGWGSTSTETSTGAMTGPTSTTSTLTSMSGATSAAASSTGEGSTSTGAGSMSTSEGSMSTSESSGGASSDGASSGGGAGETLYAAQFYFGGLDRIFVRKADHGTDLCTAITFVWPGSPDPMVAITLPGLWSTDDAWIAQGAATCLDFMVPPTNPVWKISAEGSASWAPAEGCPGSLDLDITLHFPQGRPWVPAQDLMKAFGVPVQGC